MTLVECLVALVLASLLGAAVVSVLATQNRLLRALTARSADADALRLTAGVLREELRWADPLRDLRAIGGDSLVLRTFRGGGRICSMLGDRITIEYTGTRQPAADKDSLLLHSGGRESVHAVREVTDAVCGTAAGVRLRLDSPAPGAAVYALVFESGSYFLRDRALRYRLGSEGRQPLTDERFAAGGHSMLLASDTSATLVRLLWPDDRAPAALRVPFLNSRP